MENVTEIKLNQVVTWHCLAVVLFNSSKILNFDRKLKGISPHCTKVTKKSKIKALLRKLVREIGVVGCFKPTKC